MTETKKLKWLFGLLYFVQGSAISFFSIFQKPYLSGVGVNKNSLALFTSLLMTPFILKIFFGLLSDRFPMGKWGNRKPFMFIGVLIGAVCFIGAGFFPASDSFIIYATFILIGSFSIAFFDAATDGLAVDRIAEEQQGSVQGFMVSGKAVGVILMSLVIGQIVEVHGYSTVFWILGILYILPLIFIFNLKNSINLRRESFQIDKKDKKLIFLTTIFAIFYSFVSFGTDGLIGLHLSETFNIIPAQIGNYGFLRGTGAIIGAFLASWFYRKFNTFSIFYFGLGINFLGVLLIVFVLNSSNFYFIGNIWGMAWGFQEVCFLTLAMKVVSRFGSAFWFAFLMAAGNLGTALAEGVLTSLAMNFSYTNILFLTSLVIVLPVFILKKIQPHLLKRELC